MANIDDGGSAFPESYTGEDRPHEGIGGGMSLRDYFAAKMIPLAWSKELANPSDFDDGKSRSKGVPHHESAAREAYRMADALLAERAKSTEVKHAD